MSQTDIFADGEADAYTKRNAAHNAQYRIEDDVVAQSIEACDIKPRSIFDLGCSTGERLEALASRYEASFAHGLDSSRDAINAAIDRRHPRIGWWHDDFPRWMEGHSYDLVIASYVLHWVDRSLLMETLACLDECVAPGGHLLINDFDSIADVPYAHTPGITTFKRHYARMFTSTGLYDVAWHKPYGYKGSDEPCACTVLRKR